jgi:hypothetical protein
MGRKPPPLTLVGPDTTGTQPPRTLGKSGGNLWRTLTANYRFDDVGGLELLTQLCGAIDRIEALAERIRADGEVIYVRGVPRVHPALKDETQLRALIARLLQRLGLTVEAVKPVGRPSGLAG